MNNEEIEPIVAAARLDSDQSKDGLPKRTRKEAAETSVYDGTTATLGQLSAGAEILKEQVTTETDTNIVAGN